MLQIWRAELDSENFHFDAIGMDEESAREALEIGLRAHARQHRIDGDWYRSYEIRTRVILMGAAYRDREEI